MRILYVLNATTEAGGATKSFLSMLKGLIKMGVEAQVVVPDRNGVYSTLNDLGVQVYVINFRAHIYPKYNSLKNLFLFLPRLLVWQRMERKAIKVLTDIVRTQQFDIIHTNVSVVNIGYEVSRKLNIPHVYHIREYGDLDFGMKYFPCRKQLLRQLQKTDSWSVCITRLLQLHYGLDNCPRSKVIYNGVIDEKNEGIKSVELSEHRFFLYAGRVEKAKGVEDLIDAYIDYAGICGGTPLPLYIAGEISDNTYHANLLQKLHNKTLRESVHFLGQVDKIKELMANAWAIIIPSPNEGFGRCMAEAMSEHCLVIGRNTGGTKEQFDNGLQHSSHEIGLRFQSKKELTALLRSVAQMDQEERRSFADPAFTTVNQLYTVENNVARVWELYKEILNIN